MKTNKTAFDYWTAGHIAAGAGLALLKLTNKQALLFAILWEVVEQPFTNESPVNRIVDSIATYAGYQITKRIL